MSYAVGQMVPASLFFCGYLQQDFKDGCVFLISAREYLYKGKKKLLF